MNKLKPKPPELLQKIEWIRLYGLRYWKSLLVALVLILAVGGWKYYSSITPEIPRQNSTRKPKSIGTEQKPSKEAISAPIVRFSDGTSGTVEMFVQAQLDPDLLLQSFSLYGSAEAAKNSLERSIRGAAISILEKKTQDYVRAHREEVVAEIINRTKDAQKRTAYRIIELSIGEIY